LIKILGGGATITALITGGVLFVILVFAFLALFTGKFGEKTVERIVGRVIGALDAPKAHKSAGLRRAKHKPAGR
jgi:hypothetical protein